MEKIVIPELGEGIHKATVALWHFKIGDSVKEGDDVVELVTDKASFNVPSHCEGILKSIMAKEGEEIKIGAALAFIEPV